MQVLLLLNNWCLIFAPTLYSNRFRDDIQPWENVWKFTINYTSPYIMMDHTKLAVFKALKKNLFFFHFGKIREFPEMWHLCRLAMYYGDNTKNRTLKKPWHVESGTWVLDKDNSKCTCTAKPYKGIHNLVWYTTVWKNLSCVYVSITGTGLVIHGKILSW